MVSSESLTTEPKYRLGPHGLGDPDDRSLRKVEIEILVPKKMRDKAKAEKCVKEVSDFLGCCKENGVTMVVNCRKENSVMKECLTHWFRDVEFQKICKEEYLNERSEYRRTGIGKKNLQKL